MHNNGFFTLSIILVLFTNAINAQSFSLTGEFRPRIEYRNGYKTLPEEGSEPAFLVNERTRLTFDYRSKRMHFKFTPQHTGLWGQNSFNNSTESNFSIYEAYADLILCSKELDSLKGPDVLKLRLGRQELNYDGGRILSNLDWAPQGIRHDAALLFIEEKGWEMKLGAGFNQQSDVLFGTSFYGNYYKSMQLFHLHKKMQKLDLALLFFKDDYQETTTDSLGNISADGINSRITAGTRLQFEVNKNVSINGEFYQQAGNDISGNELNAQLYSFELVVKTIQNKLTLISGVDLLSGNDGINPDNNNHYFNPTYGINHKFYGYMDYFYAGNSFGSCGLKDFYLRTIYTFNDKWNTWVHLHAFNSFADLPSAEDPAKAADSFLGTEIDLLVNYKFDAQVNIQFGTCFMFGTETLKQIKGVSPDGMNTGNFTYLQFSFKPKFFETAQK